LRKDLESARLFGVIRARISACIYVLFICGAIFTNATARGQIDAEQYRADLNAICASPSRAIGEAGYYDAGRYLEAEIGKLPNVELKKHEYGVMVPVTESATLIAGGRTESIYPFWPAGVRTSSTPVDGIDGKVVYAGICHYQDLKPGALYGQIAVIEASAGDRWSEVFYQGARAALVLGGADTSWTDLKDHDLRIPVNFPRFYVPPGKLAEDLRAGRISEATLKASVEWKHVAATNYYALVKPVKAASGKTATVKSAGGALMFSVPLDSTSLVPDLSPGASQAVQTAAGLALVRDIAKHPWRRPVIVFFSGADGIQFLGTRNMFMALGSPPSTWQGEIESLNLRIAKAKFQRNRATEIQDSPQRLSVTADRGLIDRIVEILDADRMELQDRLFQRRSEKAPGADETADIPKLEDEQQRLNRLHGMFRDNPGALSDPAYLPPAREYVHRTIARLGGRVVLAGAAEAAPTPSVSNLPGSGLIEELSERQVELARRVELYHWLAKAEGRDSDGKQGGNLIDLLVALDLSDRGQRAGPMSFGYFQRAANGARDALGSCNEWLQNQATASAWWKDVKSEIDLDPLRGARSPISYLAGPLPLGSELAQGWGIAGMSMVTLDDLRLHRDTPTDTVDRIDVSIILAQLSGVRDLFKHAWNDATFRGQGRAKQLNAGFTGQVVSASPGKPVPDLPRDGFLATYSYILNGSVDKKIPPLAAMPWTLGVRRNEIAGCDSLGNYRFEGLPQFPPDLVTGAYNVQNDLQTFAVNVYKLESRSGAITATTDYGKQAEDMKWSADIKQDVAALRSVPFDCQEFSLPGMYDPRFLQTLGEISVLDARRGAEPQHFSVWLDNMMLAGFVEAGLRTDLLVRYGSVGNRLILVNVPKGLSSEGIGFTSEQLNHLGPVAVATARDFYRLDDQRLENYRRAGVSSSLVDKLHGDAGEQLRAAEKAIPANDGVSLMRDASGAWANEARVYDAAQSMARDVVRAAIFLLMICVPFSFCMERLLFATPNVYRQITGVAGIFMVMTAALWTFHPAFKISASPLIIVLAFAIMAMSGLVIFVVYGKFDTELKRIRSGRGSSAGASFTQASVLLSAVLLGIANMRRRKFRTLLTSLTIVLITFAILWFTSTTRYLGTTTIATGIPSSNSGILLRQRGFRPMPGMMADQVRAVLADPALKIEAPKVVERWWAVSVDPQDEYDVVVMKNGEERNEFAVPAVLGISRGESNLSRIAEVIGRNEIARLENGETNIVYLSSALAERFELAEGDMLRLGGIDVQIAGIFSADDYDRDAQSLSGDEISPLKYSAGQLDTGGQTMDDTSMQSLDTSGTAGAAEVGMNYEHLSASDFLIVPASLCRQLMNSSLRSLTFRLRDQQEVERVSDELARRFAVAIYAGYDDGVRMVSGGNLSTVNGASQVAVPLAIAALIIFNTMMGSIAERKREIHVYTSLGLAPAHVGALFVAEAMTYGLVGTVFGYIIGQGMGTLLVHLGWLGNVTLNYSGSSAMVTMGLILLVVFLSALIPARVASKIAAPSIDRTWKVPTPVDDEILAILPFTINRTAADGALAYIAEYFESHREGSIGKFAADRVNPVDVAEAGSASHALKTTVWLTPYDLGVRQEVMLLIHPGAEKDIFEVEVRLRRQSGDDGSWQRMNKSFLTELRKQFLQWRSLAPARMMQYVEESKRLFERAAVN
jgi:ABC-type antimicrobial peptide transport system permease subunit